MTYRRIACLSTEAVETLYALGAQDAIAGISGFTVRPPQARRDKPKISGFSSAKLERILAVEPDLVIGFSDMQADICRDLAKAGVELHLFNHRNLAGILRMVTTLAALVDRQDEGKKLVADLQGKLAAAEQQARQWTQRPGVYFEEWNEPMISAVGWVSELITIAGGHDVFAELAGRHAARERVIADPAEVVARAPDIILGSWCGRKFQPEAVRARAGWNIIPAVVNDLVVEIKSADILAPGPSAINEGLPQIVALIARWQHKQTAQAA